MNYALMWNELRKRIGETRKLYFDLKNAGVKNEGLTGYNIMCDIERMLNAIEHQEEIREKLKNTFCLESKCEKDEKYYNLRKLFESEENYDVDNN